MQRYFVAPEAMSDRSVVITGDDVKHITRVLRMRPGDIILCCDGNGRTAEVSLSTLSDREVVGNIIEWRASDAESTVRITLIQGLPKSDKFDWIVQKGTELGVSAFWPVVMERSVAAFDASKETRKGDRWKRIAKEAAEQAGRDRIPMIFPTRSLSDCLVELHRFDLLLIPYEGEREVPLRRLLREREDDTADVGVVIGPEGGLAQNEIASLTQYGAKTVTLGPRILRTETAGLVTAAAIFYEFGQLGG